MVRSLRYLLASAALLAMTSSFTGCVTSRVTSSLDRNDTLATISLHPFSHRFLGARSVSIDQFGALYVVDESANGVYKFSQLGDSLRSAVGIGAEHYQFNGPRDIDARLTTSVWVADRYNHRVEQYTKELGYTSTLSNRSSSDVRFQFGYPVAVAADDASNLYVVDGENKRVLKLRPDLSPDRTFGGYSSSTRPEGVLSNPIDIAIDADQRIVLLDQGGESIVTYDQFGNVLLRRALEPPARAIAIERTLAYVLSSSNSVRIYDTRTLAEAGQLVIQSTTAHDWRGIAVRGEKVYLLSASELFASELTPTAATTH